MPLLPLLGSNGELLDLSHAGSVHNAVYPSSDYGLPNDHILSQRGLDDYHSLNTTAIFLMEQQHIIQIVATATSSLSLVAALLACYWFYMMRRNFRRDLVLLLILGGSWKTLWFVVFSLVTFTQGAVKTEDKFCQASGYMSHVGFELCDFAVLFMSVHMYLQIFPPQQSWLGLGHDGLYRIRHWVMAAWLLIPTLSGALAFANPRPAFMAQGGFCNLPLRPIYYRLALFWIPRYLIWIYVIFVTVSIYRYVGSEFKVFAQEKHSSTMRSLSDEGGASFAEEKRHSRQLTSFNLEQGNESEEDCAPDDMSSICRTKSTERALSEAIKTFSTAKATRRQSMPTWSAGYSHTEPSPFVSTSKSTPASRRGSHQVANGTIADDFAPASHEGHRASINSLASMRSMRSSTAGSLENALGALPPIVEGEPVANEKVRATSHSASRAIRQRRRVIQRQTRLLFIYPCVYMLLWIVPFAVNIMNYTDYFAQHPNFPLRVVSLTCMMSMTFVDVVIFCWRERPWRHIPGSDGSFWGSFLWWRFCFEHAWAQDRRASKAPSHVGDQNNEREKDEKERSESQAGLLGSLKRWSIVRKLSSPRGSDASAATAAVSARPTVPHKRTFSGGSDRRFLDAERAHERLALERAEYEQNRQSLQDKRSSVVSKDRKEWFDQQVE
ncbi:G protein-coupled receptor gpr1 [Vermiconidia calcicola]|uniref:G protein-coupled receptor gpr1 n=1 Tax=Vermiconidia calcicola TaxID=1690605 RepID=A0ACC3NFB3_9PEZI|nr:G protein-coupled receptor gpr1 [Vermiconidia calcicola]